MWNCAEAYNKIRKKIPEDVGLVAVSKTHPLTSIEALYALGAKDFGENKVQEILKKAPLLPLDVRWHMIGHLQRNKVKLVLPWVYMIHSVDSERLYQEIKKESEKQKKKVKVLLQVHVAQEESKFGIPQEAFLDFVGTQVDWNHPYVEVSGLMGMGSQTEDNSLVGQEFGTLKFLFDEVGRNSAHLGKWEVLSMGMSHDYGIAIAQGSNLLRIGSQIFGPRNA